MRANSLILANFVDFLSQRAFMIIVLVTFLKKELTKLFLGISATALSIFLLCDCVKEEILSEEQILIGVAFIFFPIKFLYLAREIKEHGLVSLKKAKFLYGLVTFVIVVLSFHFMLDVVEKLAGWKAAILVTTGGVTIFIFAAAIMLKLAYFNFKMPEAATVAKELITAPSLSIEEKTRIAKESLEKELEKKRIAQDLRERFNATKEVCGHLPLNAPIKPE